MKQIFLGLALTLLLAGPIGLQAYYYLPLAPETAVNPILRQRLMYATLRIKMYAPARQRDGSLIEVGSGTLHDTSAGLGTLVVNDGATWIVTHAHWATPFDSLSHVVFSSTDDRELLTLSRSAFLRLVHYRDNGTLILRAPWPLATKAAVRMHNEPLRNGTRVHAIYQDPDTRSIEVMPMVIDLGLTHEGQPAWLMRSLKRRSVAPGNSGAGVFLNGRLIGNVWLSTRFDVKIPYGERPLSRRLSTYLSTAAQLPHAAITARNRQVANLGGLAGE